MIFFNAQLYKRGDIIDILGDQQEDDMDKKISKLLKDSELDKKMLREIVDLIMENIEPLEESLGPTQKIRYEASKITDNLLLETPLIDFSKKSTYIDKLTEVKPKILQKIKNPKKLNF